MNANPANPFIPASAMTLADLVDEIRGDRDVSPSKVAQFASAANLLAKGAGVSLQAIPAHPDPVRRHLERCNPAAMGITGKRLSNAKSLVLWGLKHVGIVSGQFYSSSLAPEWQALRDQIKDKYLQGGFSRLFQYASAQGIKPEAFNDQHSEDFRSALEQDSLVKNPRQVHQTACRLWNRQIGVIAGWPDHQLTVPRYFEQFTLDWDKLPEAYRLDAEAYLEHLESDDPFDLNLPPKPLRPESIKRYKFMLRQCASILLSKGMDEGDLGGLYVLADLDNVKTILSHFIEDPDNKRAATAADLARLLAKIARHWVKADAEVADTIGGYAKRIKPVEDGLNNKNRERLAPLRDERRLFELYNFPLKLIDELAKIKEPSVADTRRFQLALGLLFLSFCPLRISDLASLDVNQHFKWSGPNRTGEATLDLPAAETKNKQALSFQLPSVITKSVRIYMDRFRPRLTRANNGLLFIGTNKERQKRSDTLSKQLTKMVRNGVGLDVNPHLYRHIVHLIVLRRFPGAFEMVSKILGHKSVNTTLQNYASENIALATEAYHEIIGAKLDPTSTQTPSPSLDQRIVGINRKVR